MLVSIRLQEVLMKVLNMESSLPYRRITGNCETRPIRDKEVTWPGLDGIMTDERFSARMIGRDDFAAAAGFWRLSYPEVYGSSERYVWMLYPDRYEENVAVNESWEDDKNDKIFCMPLIFDNQTGEIAGGAIYTKDDANLHVEFSFGGIRPEYRKGATGEKIAPMVVGYLKKLESDSGAEYLSAFCETWHNISQFLCLKVWGWKVAGIFPGQFTRWCGGNSEYRGCTVHFYKLIGDAEKFSTKPGDWTLLPEIETLWQALEEVNRGSRDATGG